MRTFGGAVSAAARRVGSEGSAARAQEAKGALRPWAWRPFQAPVSGSGVKDGSHCPGRVRTAGVGSAPVVCQARRGGPAEPRV